MEFEIDIFKKRRFKYYFQFLDKRGIIIVQGRCFEELEKCKITQQSAIQSAVNVPHSFSAIGTKIHYLLHLAFHQSFKHLLH